MSVEQAIQLMYNRINTRTQYVGGTFAGFGGTTGNIQMQQRDANRAVELWQSQHDASGLVQLASTLQAYGNLTDAEYEQIMESLDGEK